VSEKPRRRRAIPARVKLQVVIRQEGRCAACNEKLGKLEDTEFDHVPALWVREWNQEAQDTVPPANDPDALFAKHVDCHRAKSSGRRGEKTVTSHGSDAHAKGKVNRLTRQQEEFRSRILAKDAGEPVRRKSRWPKRPMKGRRR
jgi:hypothetical protein